MDDGSMDGSELQLFSLIDNARQQHGCAPLRRNSDLSGGAGSEADQRAHDNNFDGDGSRSPAVGGDELSPGDAFNRMMDQNSGTVLNCGLHELGVGRGTKTYKKCTALLCLTSRRVERVGWVADFR
jgi:hypothetical protein